MNKAKLALMPFVFFFLLSIALISSASATSYWIGKETPDQYGCGKSEGKSYPLCFSAGGDYGHGWYSSWWANISDIIGPPYLPQEGYGWYRTLDGNWSTMGFNDICARMACTSSAEDYISNCEVHYNFPDLIVPKPASYQLAQLTNLNWTIKVNNGSMGPVTVDVNISQCIPFFVTQGNLYLQYSVYHDASLSDPHDCMGSGYYKINFSCQTDYGVFTEVATFAGISSYGEAGIYEENMSYEIFNDFPNITIESPKNRTYKSGYIPFNATTDSTPGEWLYSINGSENVSFTPNITLILGNGTYLLEVYANNSINNTGYNSVYFTIDPKGSQPLITIQSPQNTTYNTTPINLDVSSNDTMDTWRYSINGSANVTFTPNTTIDLGNGTYHLLVYANNVDGNADDADVSFTANIQIPPTIPQPKINVYSPINTTYNTTSIPLKVSANDTIDTWLYNLNEAGNNTFTPNITLTLGNGTYNIVIFANNSAGKSDDEIIEFTVAYSPSAPPTASPFTGMIIFTGLIPLALSILVLFYGFGLFTLKGNQKPSEALKSIIITIILIIILITGINMYLGIIT